MKKQFEDRRVQKFAAAIGGGTVLAVGLVAIPYPGPGWLIVFAGLAILAREFEWAGRVLSYAKDRYNKWQTWVSRQSIVLKVLMGLLTTFVVIVTIYLLNGYGIINSLLNLNMQWLQSPFFK